MGSVVVASGGALVEGKRHDGCRDARAPDVDVQLAAEKLGDVVYVDLPKAGTQITSGNVVGEIESTKSVGELFAPVDGEVVEANQAVIDAPELVNSDPFGEGWMVRIEPSEMSDLDQLLTAEEYAEYIGAEQA